MKLLKTTGISLSLTLIIIATCINFLQIYATNTPPPLIIVAGSSNHYAYVFDENGTILWSYDCEVEVASVAISADGRYIVVGALESKLYFFTVDGTKLWEKSVPIAFGGAGNGRESKSVAVSADGEYIAAGCTNDLYVYKKDGTLHWSHAGKETCVGISPNAAYIVACNKDDGTIDFFSISSNTPLWTKSIGAFWVATSNPGYVIAGTSSKAYMFNNAGTQLWSYTLDRGGIVRVDMPDDGLTAIAVNDDPGDIACYLWYFNLTGLVWKYTPCPPQHDFYSGSISADGNIISMGPGNIGGIYVFSRNGTSLQTMPKSSWVQSVDLTSDGRFGVWGDRTYGTVWLFSKDSATPMWNYTIGGSVQTVAICGAPVFSVFISPHSASINVGQSVAFASTVIGGTPPYTYQWYLNGNPVLGATSATWTFTPVAAGSYTIYLNVTDSLANTTKSNEASVAVAPLPTVSISPTSASILVGQSVLFTSTASGGLTPYSYQWYLNGNPVSGATSNTWTFTPTTSGIFHVYLKVTDASNNVAQSETARITVSVAPVGGYSISLTKQTPVSHIVAYAIAAILTTVFTAIRRKTTTRTKDTKSH